jgi:hypothetical protein
MNKKIISLVLILACVFSLGAFAYEKKSAKFNWMASYNKQGQINLYGTVGFYGLGFNLSGGPEYTIINFDAGGVPIDLGITVRGMLGFASFLGASWVDWGIAPMAVGHWGMDFGGSAKFELYLGAGLGISGSTVAGYYGYGGGIGFGFATFDGVAWKFADNWALILEAGYTGYAWMGGIGVKFNF